MHFACVEKNILGTNGIVGAGIPIAAGVGYSIAYRGTDQLVACFLGDGAANTGAFHEGINFATVVDAPVLFVIENNQWAISVPRKWSDRLEDLEKRIRKLEERVRSQNEDIEQLGEDNRFMRKLLIDNKKVNDSQ